jgi:hypothetical protein
VGRLEAMIEVLKRVDQWIQIDGNFAVAVKELDRLLTAFDYGKKLPGLGRANPAPRTFLAPSAPRTVVRCLVHG